MYVYLLVHPPTGTYKVIKDFYVRRVICNSGARKYKKKTLYSVIAGGKMDSIIKSTVERQRWPRRNALKMSCTT